MRPIAFTILAGIALIASATVFPAIDAGSPGQRIVWPYGLDERHIPVVAGYEVAPRPLGCDVGTPNPTNVLFSEDFESPDHALALGDPAQIIFGGYRNLFHQTTFAGVGTEDGHSAPGRFYFGHDTTGMYRDGYRRLAGIAELPPVTLPAVGPTYVAWNEKFEVEAFFGYDHMWMELVDAQGEIYILCSSDADSRPDKSSSDNTIGSCSPYRVGVCPTKIRGHGGLNCAGVPPTCIPTGLHNLKLEDLGVDRVDSTAPHWHARYVQIPPHLGGQTVTLRLSFDSADGVSNNFMGWMVDDVVVFEGTVTPQPYVYVPRDPDLTPPEV